MKRTFWIGQSLHTLDSKNRLFIPPKFREALKKESDKFFILTSGLDGCLYLYLPSQWEKILSGSLQSFNLANKEEERAFKRKFFAEATEAPLDVQGRILLPQLLKSYAGIKRNVYIQGVANRIEIWDEDRWKRYYREKVIPSLKKLSRSLEI